MPVSLMLLATLCLHPAWLDAELARRALAMSTLGVLLLLQPRAFAARPNGDRALVALIGWLACSAIWHHDRANSAEAVLRIGWWTTLLLTARLGAASNRDTIARTTAVLLVLAAGLGMFQSLGVTDWLGTQMEPVSVFGNRNTAAEFTAVATAVLAARFHSMPRLASFALLLGSCYAIANGSRSGLVGLPLGVVIAAAAASLPLGRRLLPCVPTALGLLLGVGCSLAAAGSATSGTGPDSLNLPGHATRTATLEVRLQIALAGLRMVADAPILGHGPGQFAVEYPRYRSQREIELSSLSRTEMRRVGTAHDDWLETAIEAGVPALVLLVLFVVARGRGRTDRSGLAPLAVLLALMIIRAPLGNAPAALLALLASSPILGEVELRPLRAWWLRVVGIALLCLGAAGVASAGALARYVASRADQPLGDTAPLRDAVAIAPWDPVAWQLLAQELQARATDLTGAQQALAAADRAATLRPFEPSYLLLRADLLRMCGQLDESKRQLAEITKLDPSEPQVQVQLAGVYFTDGDVDGAVIALCTDPPAVLRKQLALRLEEFADLCAARNSVDDMKRFQAEAAFVRTLDALATTGTRANAIAKEHFDTMRGSFAVAGLRDRDVRELLLLAVLSYRVGDATSATAAGQLAQKRALPLPAWQWSLLRDVAAPLRALPAWLPLLPRTGT